jgi:PIN domain
MKPSVYIETTIVSYLTARASRDLYTTAHQQLTHEWWERERHHFRLVSSQIVIEEASFGDRQFSQKRLDLLATIEVLEIGAGASAIADELLKAGVIPVAVSADAMHVAIAAAGGVDYLLTWNCRHLANATIRSRIDDVCRNLGFKPPIICTPEELMED